MFAQSLSHSTLSTVSMQAGLSSCLRRIYTHLTVTTYSSYPYVQLVMFFGLAIGTYVLSLLDRDCKDLSFSASRLACSNACALPSLLCLETSSALGGSLS